jgi:hypothetical protein
MMKADKLKDLLLEKIRGVIEVESGLELKVRIKMDESTYEFYYYPQALKFKSYARVVEMITDDLVLEILRRSIEYENFSH